ncbi:MAG: SURF1 family protein [Psychrosphaera sp.]|nr:SURF1 family protein [Psychrosphaera sp.]
MIIEVGLYRFQLRTIPVLVTLVAFAILARLGMWQLERGWFKEQRLQQIADFKQVDKITFASLLKIIEQSDPTGVDVTVNGQFANPYSWLLDNKVVNGQVGYDVLLAYKPGSTESKENREGRNRWLLVNMGWIKGDYANRDVLPEFVIPSGNVTLTAYVKAKDLSAFALSDKSINHQQWPLRTQQVNIDTFEKQSGLNFYPFMLIASDTKKFGFTHHYQPVVMPPEKHHAYALTWFLLALAIVIVFIFASRIKPQEELS